MPLVGAGQPLELNRIRLVMIIMTAVVSIFFLLAFRKPRLVPRGLQNIGEIAVDFIKVHIIDASVGEKGRKYLPYLGAVFFLVLAFNISGIIPGLQVAGTSVVALPLILAFITWAIFNYAGIQAHGLGRYLKANLFPSGLPWYMYILVAPIEAISTFVLRPVTLTIRLMGNMMAGHIALMIFFGGTSFLLLGGAGWALAPVGVLSFGMGMAFTAFELLVAFLQAYIFTLLTAIYLDGALSEAH